MKKYFLSCCSLMLLSLSLSLFAQEPSGLWTSKQLVRQYHDSGQYAQDIAHVIDKAQCYLASRLQHWCKDCAKPAIVFDIDETAVSNYGQMSRYDFGGNEPIYVALRKKYDAPAIKPTLALYRYAVTHHVAVFFITGRNASERETTLRTLRKAGYDQVAGLMLRPDNDHPKTISTFKVKMREDVERMGYRIVLNIGDQESDLAGGHAERSFKLPNPYYHLS